LGLKVVRKVSATRAAVFAAFIYHPEWIRESLRFMTHSIETIADQVPEPWGARIEIMLRELGGIIWLQIAAESVENNPKQAGPADEPNLERPHRRSAGGEREADREQAKREAEHEGQRGMGEPNKLDPTPGLPDGTLISDVEFPARIRKVLTAAGLKTVGEIRETSDDVLLSSRDIGRAAVARLRETLGLPSTDGVRPLGKKPA
jgi:hypothetical protein